jgi:hypothetical protein
MEKPMNSNESAIEHLNLLIAGDRIERDHSPYCDLCGNVITAKAQVAANVIKGMAAEIIVRLNAPDAAPDLWAQLVKHTKFDNFDAAVCRGEAEASRSPETDAARNIKLFLDRVMAGSGRYGDPEPPRRTAEALEADKQRHVAYWEEYKRREPQMFKVKGPKHLNDCPNRPKE